MKRTDLEAERTALTNVLFYLGFSIFIGHELDAVLHAEWKLLFIPRSLPEPTAASAFILLHIPLVAIILWLGNHPKEGIQSLFRVMFSALLAVHGVLHFILSDVPDNTFSGFASNVLIYSPSGIGLAYIVASLWPGIQPSGRS